MPRLSAKYSLCLFLLAQYCTSRSPVIDPGGRRLIRLIRLIRVARLGLAATARSVGTRPERTRLGIAGHPAARSPCLAPQPYTERRSQDVPPQRPAQRPGRGPRASPVDVRFRLRRIVGTPCAIDVGRAREQAHRPRPMWFMWSFCRSFHNGDIPRSPSPQRYFTQHGVTITVQLTESSQVEFVTPNIYPVWWQHLMPV